MNLKIIFLLQVVLLSLSACKKDEGGNKDEGCNGLAVTIFVSGRDATATVSGGTSPYNFSWSNGSTSATQINLCPGTYTLSVTDSVNCTVLDSATVQGSSCNGITSVTDSDGNTYPVVEICGQCWMRENLRVSAGIAEVSDSLQWANIGNNGTQTPAWCYYRNNPANAATYGKLYNWYAVNTGNLCPSGWHIPTDAEWKTSEMNLGMSQYEADQTGYRGASANVGGQLKATTFWESPNTGATNNSGFTGLPGGFRGSYGYFITLGSFGLFWSSTKFDTLNAWIRELNRDYSEVRRDYDRKAAGFSCRCLKD